MAFSDLSGRTFGRLTVIEVAPRSEWKYGESFWKCECVCGEMKTIRRQKLMRSETVSCGCFRAEVLTESSDRYRGNKRPEVTTHGLSGIPEYAVWSNMKQRCYNPNNSAYRWYGLRGVEVCDEWRDDFAQFYADMGPRPEGYTIERLDSDGDYCRSNCVWVPYSEQVKTRRNPYEVYARV